MSLLDSIEFSEGEGMSEFSEKRVFTLTLDESTKMDEKTGTWTSYPRWVVAEGSDMTFGDLLGSEHNDASNSSLGYVGSPGSMRLTSPEVKNNNLPGSQTPEEDLSILLEEGRGGAPMKELENSDGYVSASPTKPDNWSAPVPGPSTQASSFPIAEMDAATANAAAAMEVDVEYVDDKVDITQHRRDVEAVEDIQLSELLRPRRLSEGQVQEVRKKEVAELTRKKGPEKKLTNNADKSKTLLMERDTLRLMLEAYTKEHTSLKAKHEQLRREALSRGLGRLLMHVNRDITNDTAASGQQTK